MVKPGCTHSPILRDLRDKASRDRIDNLKQRREERELEEGRAVIKALEHKLQDAKGGGAGRKQERYVQTSSELHLAEQQLSDEQKKVCRLEAELEDSRRATATAQLAASAAPRDEEATATAQRAQEDAAKARVLLEEKQPKLKTARARLQTLKGLYEFVRYSTGVEEEALEALKNTLQQYSPADLMYCVTLSPKEGIPASASPPSGQSRTTSPPPLPSNYNISMGPSPSRKLSASKPNLPVAEKLELLLSRTFFSSVSPPALQLISAALHLAEEMQKILSPADQEWLNRVWPRRDLEDNEFAVNWIALPPALKDSTEDRAFEMLVWKLYIKAVNTGIAGNFILLRAAQPRRPPTSCPSEEDNLKLKLKIEEKRVELLAVEQRRSELEGQLSSARHNLYQAPLPHPTPSPSPSTTIASSIALPPTLRQLATTANELSSTILRLREENVELLGWLGLGGGG